MEDEAEAAAAMDSPAKDQVFSTPELAEIIFMELPPRRILVTVQRVCRQWQAVINGSIRIQQALFHKPIPSTKLQSVPRTKFRYFFNRPSYFSKQIVCFHPMFLEKLESIGHDCALQEKYEGPHRSWRQALLSQPQLDFFVTRAEPVPEEDYWHQKTGEYKTILAPHNGFRLGQAVDEIRELIDDELLMTVIPSSDVWHGTPCAWKHSSTKKFLRMITGETKARK